MAELCSSSIFVSSSVCWIYHPYTAMVSWVMWLLVQRVSVGCIFECGFSSSCDFFLPFFSQATPLAASLFRLRLGLLSSNRSRQGDVELPVRATEVARQTQEVPGKADVIGQVPELPARAQHRSSPVRRRRRNKPIDMEAQYAAANSGISYLPNRHSCNITNELRISN